MKHHCVNLYFSESIACYSDLYVHGGDSRKSKGRSEDSKTGKNDILIKDMLLSCSHPWGQMSASCL